MTATRDETITTIPHVVAGAVIHGEGATHRSRDRGATLITPRIDPGELVLDRSQPPPAAALPLAEVLAFLSELGRQLDLDGNEHLQWALDTVVPLSTTPRQILEYQYRQLGRVFSRDVLEAQLAASLDPAAIDGWVPAPSGRGRVRAYPPRLVHLLAGNSPLVAAVTVVWTALLKGVGLMKLPSNDPCSAIAILRTMADIDPNHPVLRSLSAVYWQGGDTALERLLLRPQYFDKLVAWGGEAALRHAKQYIGPGLELVAFDPKISISLVGREAFAGEDALRRAARAAAIDTTLLNQDACASSRFHFVEGTVEQVDRYCEALLPELGMERPLATTCGAPTPSDLRDEVDVLRDLEPDFRVFGDYSGAGLIVRSADPLAAHPDGRTVNVVPVGSLLEATTHATVAAQTVGVFPAERKAEVRDALAARGVQRIVTLAEAGELEFLTGLPHDGMYVLSRLARWTVDQGAS